MTTASSVIAAPIRVSLAKACTLAHGPRDGASSCLSSGAPIGTTSAGRSCELRECSADRLPGNVRNRGQVKPGLRRWL
jgi:hypothetical protein